MPGVDLSHTVLEVDSYGGAMNRKEMLEGTVAFQRSSIIKMQFQTYWSNPRRTRDISAGYASFITSFTQALKSMRLTRERLFRATTMRGAISTIPMRT